MILNGMDVYNYIHAIFCHRIKKFFSSNTNDHLTTGEDG